MHNIRRIIAKTLVTLSIATCVCTPVQYVGAASYLADGEILLADISSTDTSTQEKFMNLSPTIGSNESEKNITWYSLIEGNAKVEVAKKTENLEFPTEGVATFEATSGASNLTDYYSNQATITGLEANTEYMYRVANQGEYSETYTFKTSTDGAYSFLLAGDPQIGTGGVLNGVDGWKDTLEKASSLFPDASFLLSAGDQVNTASSESEYTGYLTQSVLYSLASATTIGNHDSSSVAYNEHFNLPNEGEYGKTTAGSDYWFTYNDTLFMVINTNNTSTAEHKAFMEEAMALNPDAKWNVVTFHHSIYSVASHATETSIIN